MHKSADEALVLSAREDAAKTPNSLRDRETGNIEQKMQLMDLISERESLLLEKTKLLENLRVEREKLYRMEASQMQMQAESQRFRFRMSKMCALRLMAMNNRAENVTLQERMKLLKDEMDAQQAARMSPSKADALQKELSENKIRLEKLNSEKAEALENLRQMQSKVKDLENSKQVKRKAKSDEMERKLANLERDLSDSVNRVNTLTADLKKKEAELLDIKNQNSASKDSVNDHIVLLEQKVEALESEKLELTNHIQSQRHKLTRSLSHELTDRCNSVKR
eukprot:763491-Hanusia_phi.AAC.2